MDKYIQNPTKIILTSSGAVNYKQIFNILQIKPKGHHLS